LIPHKAAALVLTRAVKKVGDEKTCAEGLGVPVSALRAYIAGTEPCPETIYLRAVDIVLGDDESKTN
jgi:hypothetical protein